MNKIHTLTILFLTLICGQIYATVTGTVQFEKRYISQYSPTGVQADIFVDLYGAQISIFNDGNSTALATTTTGSDGSFTFNVEPSGSYTIIVYSQNDTMEIGESVSSTPVTQNIYNKTTTGLTGDGPHDISISIAENSGAFNILNEMEKGNRFLNNLGYEISQKLRITWPHPNFSFFDPSDFTMAILGADSDPDEWDDDIIHHEFGHAAAESFSIDHSQGGTHGLEEQLDLRLAWSEGLATYLAYAFKGTSTYYDTNGDSTNGITEIRVGYDVASPNSFHVQTSNEVAVSYLLYQAHQETDAETVFETLAAFKDNLSKLDDEQSTMDIFFDLWTGPDLSTHYANREMLYIEDSQDGNFPSSNAVTLEDGDSFTDLTFFPDGQSDFFKHIGSIDDELTIQTSNTKNGAITKITLYRQSGDDLTEVTSSSQPASGSSVTTSSLEYKLTSSGTYIIEISRFNSETQNVGLGGSAYEKTAGTYGSYNLSFSYVRTVPISLSIHELSSSSDDSTVNTTLTNLLANSSSITLTDDFKAFGNVSQSGVQRDFTSTNAANEVTNVSVINSTSSTTTYTISDDDLPLTVSGIPAGITAVIGLIPISYESLIHDFSREKIITVDLLEDSQIYTGNFDLSFSFTGASLSNRVHQVLKQSSSSFNISDSLMNVDSNNNLLTSVTAAGVYSLRTLVNANATATDQTTQLQTFIDQNNIEDLFEELATFHHLVSDNDDEAVVNYNSTTETYVVKSSGTSSSYSNEFTVDGNVTISGIPEGLVLVMTSLPKSYATSLPENAQDQILFYNLISDDLTISNGFTLDVDLLDDGRSDFNYYLHEVNNNSFSLVNEITTKTPNLSFDISAHGNYIISANINISEADEDTLTNVIDNLLANTDTLVDLSTSTQLSELSSIGNVSTTSNEKTITLNTVSTENEIITHNDTDTPISISGVPQGNALLVITLPTSESPNLLPEGDVKGDLFSLNLYDDNSTEITTGFTIPITLEGAGDDSKTQRLHYFDDVNGQWVEEEWVGEITSGSNLTFNATHFTVFSLVETNNSDNSGSSSSGGGGGGGCLLK